MIRILQETNARLRYLPREVIGYLAYTLGIPVSRLYRIGTFYKAFSFIPRGAHTISICDGTACHIRGSPRLIAELRRELKIDVGQTTPDRRFSLEIVRCLGCCSLAPVVKVDEKIYGAVKPAEIAKILKDYPE
ncbi:MAG: NAD(P)H-dependent oxidoreductase subunit E [Kiritimatiellae bacterium]|nr:NAD(P)H-dependent oxidoreductase subunit E [Kiritimatiellia bacterium]